MNDVCGRCGHDRDAHQRGGRHEAIPHALGFHVCTCRGFRPLGALIGLRVLAVGFWCVVAGSLPALVDLITGGGAPR